MAKKKKPIPGTIILETNVKGKIKLVRHVDEVRPKKKKKSNLHDEQWEK